MWADVVSKLGGLYTPVNYIVSGPLCLANDGNLTAGRKRHAGYVRLAARALRSAGVSGAHVRHLSRINDEDPDIHAQIEIPHSSPHSLSPRPPRTHTR
jgi:hypothetical protein